ncbi:MAG: hypothetical protein D6731_18150 [Planctomycetota bacterium]|nr:MAG: hypothetical protein D6731_18150 [Planctomycetota bacterium]
MITGEELAFVRLAMRERILTANLVREAVERKKWDAPDRSLASILVDMGALDAGEAARLKRASANDGAKRRATVVGRDRLAREDPDAYDGGHPPLKKLGKYEILRLLGAGAMGAVYHARDTELRREVALKLLLKDGAAPSPRAVQRFKREARLAARLDHPNIVRVYEAGEDEGYHYIAMEMVDGRSVAELIALGEMTPRRAVHIIRKTAEAVGYAHERDVVHRDIKPANILVDAHGEARVTDFGLAVLSEGGEDDRLTRTGAAVGTPAYMAPEQVRGQLDKIDGRTDVYAIGATFYEMLTGHPPFEAPTFLELAKKICDVDPPSPQKKNPEVPLDVATICLKALEKEKTARYQRAQEMADDLAAFLADRSISAQAPGLPRRLARWGRRHPGLVAGFSGFFAVFLAAVIYYATLPGVLEVSISGSPGDVVLKVDGEERGVVPSGGTLRVELPAGLHRLRFFHPDHLEQAPGADTVLIRHGLTTPLTTTLVSRKGALRVATDPPGATVTVEQSGRAVYRATAPFFEQFLAGTYTVRASKPGYHAPPPQRVEVAPGGVQTKVNLRLDPDPSGVEVECDPEDVTIRREGDEQAYAAPVKLLGAEQRIVATKRGYLPQVLELELERGEAVRRRMTLVPLQAYRVPLHGTLAAPPLVRDVDGDGALDLLVLEDDPEGRRLSLIPGGGYGRPRFRVAVAAEVLVDAIDVDGDGVLDPLLGDRQHLAVVGGDDGRLLATLDLDAHAVAVAKGRRPAELVYASTEGVARVPLDGRIATARLDKLDPRARARPVVLDLEADGHPTTLVAIVRTERDGGRLELWEAAEGRRRAVLPLAGLQRAPRLALVSLGRGRGDLPAIVALPREGPAYVVDPLQPTAPLYRLGEPDARFREVQGLVPERGPAWLMLRDVQRRRARLYRLDPKGPREVELALGSRAVFLSTPAGPLLWSTTGACFRLEKDGWVPAPDRSAEPTPWTVRDYVPLAADLDRDGTSEVLAPAPDRRALVALLPDPNWQRWRAPLRVLPGAPCVATVWGGESVLVFGVGDRVAGRVASDGRRAFSPLPVPARVEHLVATAGKRPALYAAGRGIEGGVPFLLRFAGGSEGWKRAWGPLERPLSGLSALEQDLDGDGDAEVLVGAPLALLDSGTGEERWNDKTNRGPAVEEWAGPACLRGARGSSVCVGATALGGGKVGGVVAYTPTGKRLWTRPLESDEAPKGEADAPLRLLGHEALPRLVVAVTSTRALALRRSDGEFVWSADFGTHGARGEVFGAVLGGTTRPALVLTRSGLDDRSELRVYDAASGRPLWARVLPAGRPGARASEPVVLPRREEREAAVAVVAPTGVLLFFALRDGAYLGERRHSEGLRPWLRSLGGSTAHGTSERSAAPTLVAATDDDHVLELRCPPLRRPFAGERQRLREQIRRIALGGPFLEQAVKALPSLAHPSSPFAARAGLALAEAQMARGDPRAAARAVERVLEVAPRHLGALELRVRASFAQDPRFTPEIRDELVELARVDAARAAEVAVDLSLRAGSDAEDVRGFLNLATYLAPHHDPRAHRELGLFRMSQDLAPRLEAITRGARGWKTPKPKEVLEVLESIQGVRSDLTSALAKSEDARARAAALLVTVLEFRLAARFVPEGKARERALARLRSQLIGLQSTASLRAGSSPPFLRSTRRLAQGCARDAELSPAQARALVAALRHDLKALRSGRRDLRGWHAVLDAIDVLWRRP